MELDKYLQLNVGSTIPPNSYLGGKVSKIFPMVWRPKYSAIVNISKKL